MPSKLETEKPWCWIHQTSKGLESFYEAGELDLDLPELDEAGGGRIAKTL